MGKIIFIHGAFGTEKDLKPLAGLCTGHEVMLLNLPFHGTEAGPRFDYQSLKDGLQRKLRGYDNYSIFGYSMGGYLALDLASEGLITPHTIITYGTRFFWNQNLVQKVAGIMDPQQLMRNLPDYVTALKAMHGPHWETVISDMLKVMDEISRHPLSESQFKRLNMPVKLNVGDKDSLATPDETESVSRIIAHSSYQILPEAEHDISRLKDHNLQSLALSICAP